MFNQQNLNQDEFKKKNNVPVSVNQQSKVTANHSRNIIYDVVCSVPCLFVNCQFECKIPNMGGAVKCIC